LKKGNKYLATTGLIITFGFLATELVWGSIPNRFGDRTVNSDVVVEDGLTGLTWQKDSTHGKSWREALAECQGATTADYEDWRLPQDQELMSLVDYRMLRPASGFTEANNNWWQIPYWSSTSKANPGTQVWVVNFRVGRVNFVAKTSTVGRSVRCVRGPPN